MQNSVVCSGIFSGFLQHALNFRCSTIILQQNRSLSKSFYEKLNIPPKPPKPCGPFMRYIQQVSPAILKENPKLQRSVLVKIATQKWSQVDTKLKEKLSKEFKEELSDYRKILDDYNRRLTPEQKEEIKRAIQHNQDVKEERRTKKKAKDLGKPKRPSPVFNRFVASRESERSKYSSIMEFAKAMGAEWKSLDAETKNKLSEECKRDNEKWSADMKQWEEKMIKEGNLDVVRISSLKLSSTKAKIKK